MRRIGVKRAVANGCRWLDENFPGWEQRIDLETLRLERGETCICGQLFGGRPLVRRGAFDNGYDYARQTLFTEANSWITELVGMETIKSLRRRKKPTYRELTRASDRATRVSNALGFSIPTRGSVIFTHEWDRLQAEWVRVLKARQKEAQHV